MNLEETIDATLDASGELVSAQQPQLPPGPVQVTIRGGKYWARWGDAVREAGLHPNRMNEAYDDVFLLEQLVLLTRELGRAPVIADLSLAATASPGFPSKNVFGRLGGKAQRVARVIAFCDARPEYGDVASLWRQVAGSDLVEQSDKSILPPPTVGYVYLLKHGSRKEYKIGRTCNPLRREGEMGIQLPEKLKPIHYIETDDPTG
ncbi:MAG: GIY-YIG nuclease family protein, partial [Candidatus Saccharimonadales bacterium]